MSAQFQSLSKIQALVLQLTHTSICSTETDYNASARQQCGYIDVAQDKDKIGRHIMQCWQMSIADNNKYNMH